MVICAVRIKSAIKLEKENIAKGNRTQKPTGKVYEKERS